MNRPISAQRLLKLNSNSTGNQLPMQDRIPHITAENNFKYNSNQHQFNLPADHTNKSPKTVEINSNLGANLT